tara:strand:- start:975 stop:1109 length:135 start_codon:yes stop_codon:yes gene_type:complete
MVSPDKVASTSHERGIAVKLGWHFTVSHGIGKIEDENGIDRRCL